MSDFSERPFIAGSVLGVRSFRINKGVLTGVVHQVPWTTNTNEARCINVLAALGASFQEAGIAMAEAMHNMAVALTRINGKVYLGKAPKRPAPKPPTAGTRHRGGKLDCTCGFYAYFDGGHNPHHNDGQVLGIIEGFGVVTVGSRGFRAEKAVIKALVEPEKWTTGWRSVKRQYKNVPVFTSLNAALACFPVTNQSEAAA